MQKHLRTSAIPLLSSPPHFLFIFCSIPLFFPQIQAMKGERRPEVEVHVLPAKKAISRGPGLTAISCCPEVYPHFCEAPFISMNSPGGKTYWKIMSYFNGIKAEFPPQNIEPGLLFLDSVWAFFPFSFFRLYPFFQGQNRGITDENWWCIYVCRNYLR